MDFRFDVYAQLVEAAAEIGPSTSLSSYSAATRALRVGEVRAPQAIPTHPDRDPTRGDILETPNRLH